MRAVSSTAGQSGTHLRAGGSHLSTKDWSLPISVLDELRKVETTQELLDRMGFPIGYPNQRDSIQGTERMNPTPCMAALVAELDVRIENGTTASSLTENSLLDLFCGVAPHATPSSVNKLLDRSWEKAPADTLRIIWQARSISEGKGMNDHVFYNTMGYLYRKHPRTLLENLHLLVDKVCNQSDPNGKHNQNVEECVERASLPHGCFKDLLNLLVLAVGGFLAKTVTHDSVTLALQSSLWGIKLSLLFSKWGKKQRALSSAAKDDYRQRRQRAIQTLPDWFRKYHRASKEKQYSMIGSRLRHALEEDKVFRALYIITARLFASNIQADLSKQMSSQKSMAGKWAPTPGKAHDKHTLISTAIASIIFPTEPDPINARMSLQTKCLAPLRRALDVPEVKMAAGEWSNIEYAKVSFRCMARNRDNFLVNDTERYVRYIREPKSGETSSSDDKAEEKGTPSQKLQRLLVNPAFTGLEVVD